MNRNPQYAPWAEDDEEEATPIMGDEQIDRFAKNVAAKLAENGGTFPKPDLPKPQK
jgi:hypothetical protein